MNSFIKKTVISIFIAAVSFQVSASNEDVEVLRAVSAYPASSGLGSDFQTYIETVNEMGKGVVQIKYLGGPELTPPSEQGTMLSNGLVDMVYTVAVYFSGRFPEAEVFAAKSLPAEEVRENGGLELYNQSLEKRLNSRLIAFSDGGYGLHIFTTKKPDFTEDGLPDLSGMNLRAIPLYMPMYEALGASSSVLSFGETYTALERGMVDGVGYTLTDVEQAGWGEYLKYVILPSMYTGSAAVFANSSSLDRLSNEAQEILKKASLKHENQMYELYARKEAKALERFKNLDIEIIELEGDAKVRFNKLATSSYRKYLEGKKENFNIDLDEALELFAGE